MEQLEDVAAIGGVSTGSPDGTEVGANMTVEADDAMLAGEIAAARVHLIVGTGRVVGVEALSIEELDRRQAPRLQPA
jgi:hypothetical protein